MGSIDQVVAVEITAETRTPTRAGFGTPLIAATVAETIFPERVREFSLSSELVTLGLAADHPLIRCFDKIKAQSPSPRTVKVGRRLLPPTQILRLIPTVTAVGTVVSATVVEPDGDEVLISYTVQTGDTVALIVDAIVADLAALAGATVVDDATHARITATTPGDLFDVKSLTGGLRIEDVTTNPGIETDLTAIEAEDDDWYGLCLDSNSQAEGLAAQTWISSRKKILVMNTPDDSTLDGDAGSFGKDHEAADTDNSVLAFSGSVLGYAGAAWLGRMLPYDPGSATWAFKRLSTVVADALTTAQISTLDGDVVNYYTEVGGLEITRTGRASSGEFIDVTVTIHALTARIQEEVFAAIANLPKLEYTNKHVNMVIGIIRGVLRAFQASGALDASVDPLVEAPRVEDVSAIDRAGRLLPDVTFQARLAGAIHTIEIRGTLTV